MEAKIGLGAPMPRPRTARQAFRVTWSRFEDSNVVGRAISETPLMIDDEQQTKDTMCAMPQVTDSELLSDSAIVGRILGGEAGLFELIIRRYNPYLYKVDRSYRYTHEETEDLMQETFLQAYLHLSQFEQRSSVKTWLMRIMLNNCYHFRQRASFRNEVPHSIDETDVPMFADEQNTDASVLVLRRELAQVIEAALVRIPRGYRDVFVLRDMNNLSVADTSALLQISESNVKVRLLRARAMLRREINQAYRPEDVFEFNLVYCDAIVSRVMQKIKSTTR